LDVTLGDVGVGDLEAGLAVSGVDRRSLHHAGGAHTHRGYGELAERRQHLGTSLVGRTHRQGGDGHVHFRRAFTSRAMPPRMTVMAPFSLVPLRRWVASCAASLVRGPESAMERSASVRR